MDKITQAKKILKYFDYSFYWIKALVNLKYINEAEAGYIITLINKEGVK